MSEQDEVQRLNERIAALEQELRAARHLAWMGLAASMWQHQAHNKARNIIHGIDLIRSTDAGGLPERVARYLNLVRESAAALRDVPTTLTASSEAQSISVGDFLEEYAHTVKERMDGDFRVNLESPAGERVRINPEWLRQCVDLIVENAVEAMRDSPVKVLTISAAPAEDSVEIRISDTGPGVPADLSQQIFRAPVGAGERKGHLGFGLLIARTIVQAFGGDVRLGEVTPYGATFIISMPKE